MSFVEAFLQVSALTMTMSMPLELSIRKRPSAVKSMPITDPDTFVQRAGEGKEIVRGTVIFRRSQMMELSSCDTVTLELRKALDCP